MGLYEQEECLHDGNMGLYEQEECLQDSDIETIGTIVIYNINRSVPVFLAGSLSLFFISHNQFYKGTEITTI